MSSSNYQVFARKYRPKTFADVLGQDHVMRTLSNAITQNRLAHAYLFVGPRGTGKTSTSRIFAKALNCTGGPRVDFDPDEPVCVEIAEGRSLDVLEIDGASNNGVEQIRSLRETVHYAPSSGQYRIYYIDEVHMLTANAFNALLKTLEEPPPHVKFIFATTEAHKILPTILSRCQRFDLRRIPAPLIAQHLLHIASLEGLQLESMAAHAIAVGADGGMRDAQSMLDQLVAFCGNSVKEEDVLHVFGFTSFQTVSDLAGAILQGQTAEALSQLYHLAESGKDLSRLLGDLLFHFRNILVHRVDPDIALRDLPEEMAQSLAEQAGMAGNDKLIQLIDQFATVDASMKWALNKRLYFEIGIIRATQILGESTLSDVILALRGSLDGAGGPLPVSRSSPVASAPGNKGNSTPAQEAPAIITPGSWRAALEAEAKAKAANAVAAPAAAPAAPEPVAEAPAEPAEPAPRIAPGPELWDAVKQELARSLPLQSGYAGEAIFQEVTDQALVLAVPAAHRSAADALKRDNVRQAIERVMENLSGQRLYLQIEIREDIAPVELAPIEIRQPEPPPQAEAPAAPSKQAAKKMEEEAAARTAEEQAAREAEFRNDPLIKEALRIFEAKIAG